MTFQEYNTAAIWGNQENFNRASDEQRAEWLERAQQIDDENALLLRERIQAFDSAVQIVAEVCGRNSKSYKYMGGKARDEIKLPVKRVRAFKDAEDWRKRAIEAELKVQYERKERERMLELQRNAIRKDVEIALKFGLDTDLSRAEIITALCSCNPYLDLAVAGMKTRNDWSEGYYLVENALDRFPTLTARDHAVSAYYGELLGYPQDDGRVFRDCEWSYDKLLDIARETHPNEVDAVLELI